MPQCLERNATSFGVRSARSHSSAGAVRRRKASRVTVSNAAITLPVWCVSLLRLYVVVRRNSIVLLNSSIEYGSLAHSPPAPGRACCAGQPLQNQGRELAADPLDRGFFLTVPARHRIRHAEDGERHQPRIEIVAECSAALPLADDGFKDVLDAARPLTHAAPAFVGQELPLGEEHLDEITAVENGRNMRPDQPCELLRWRARPTGNRLRGLEEVLDPAGADDLERDLLRAEIIVEAGLANVEHIRNVLRGGAMVAALGEHARCRLDDLGRAAVRAAPPRIFARHDSAARRHAPGTCTSRGARSRFHL